jgi:hypothetical protein
LLLRDFKLNKPTIRKLAGLWAFWQIFKNE